MQGKHEDSCASQLIGNSAALRALRALIADVAASDATVLIQGETGTGKELVAEQLHALSPRAAAPLVKVNCAALPESLLEVELFGCVRGAFTDAVSDRIGRFEAAQGGTLLLDEIGDLSLTLQAKLLRVVETREFERVGSVVTRRVDVRLLASTNRDLEAAVAAGTFRADLFYRLNVVPIFVPPLRDHPADIPALVLHFLTALREKYPQLTPTLTPAAWRALMSHTFPGNVRELRNALEYVVLRAKGAPLDVCHFPPPLSAPRPTLRLPQHSAPPDEAEQIRAALQAARWHRSAAARALGMDRTTLWRKMKKYNLMREDDAAQHHNLLQ
ncbi:MAG: sigma 54-interacting transcriptional regulator [Abditibacteriales bacterium]|nr:sigma 54-interacting transcriptional regulator [Abditibacteriales bacterium]MDW8365872.1 sigma 54-interacting transcriptional regulator [Abditibacteriales bacterium]